MPDNVWGYLEAEFEKKLLDNPERRALVQRKWDELSDQMDEFVQRARGKPTLVEKYVALQCSMFAESDQIWRTAIDMGCTPYPDACIEDNNAAVSDLPEPFRGEFKPGGATPAGVCDGWVTWDGEAYGLVADRPNVPMTIKGTLPLEVGTTAAGKSYIYLTECAGFARWAYGSTTLYVFKRIKPLPGRWQRATTPATGRKDTTYD